MTGSPLQPGTGDGTSTDRESTDGAPRWVKVFGVIAIVLVGLFVVLHLTGVSPVGH